MVISALMGLVGIKHFQMNCVKIDPSHVGLVINKDDVVEVA